MNYTSADFKIQHISTYTLYIYSDYTRDQLVVVGGEGEVYILMSYDSSEPAQEAMKLLSLPFQKVYIVLPQENLIWVPTAVFSADRLTDFIPFLDEVNIDSIQVKELEPLEATAVYQYDPILFYRWRNIFEGAEIIGLFDVFLKQAQMHIPTEGSILGIHMYANSADIFLFVDEEFKIYNTFELATVDDLSYFVLQILKGFGVTGKVDKILLSAIDLDSEWAERLALYTKELELVAAKNKWIFPTSLEVDTSSYTLLTDSVLCAS